jgi:hypothetical protein
MTEGDETAHPIQGVGAEAEKEDMATGDQVQPMTTTSHHTPRLGETKAACTLRGMALTRLAGMQAEVAVII